MTRSSHFAKRVYSRRAEILFHYQPEPAAKPPAKLEAAYHIGDVAIQEPIDQLAAQGIAARNFSIRLGAKLRLPGTEAKPSVFVSNRSLDLETSH